MSGDAVTDVEMIDTLYESNLLDSRDLPDLATWLIAIGRESDALVALAGLDLAPFDPRDARDLWAAVVVDAGRRARTAEEQVLVIAQLIAVAWSQRVLSDRRAWDLIARAGADVITRAVEDSPKEMVEVVRLYWLWYEREEGGGRTPEQQELEVRALLTSLAWEAPRLPDGLVVAAARMIR